jgi:hypothetical protein
LAAAADVDFGAGDEDTFDMEALFSTNSDGFWYSIR